MKSKLCLILALLTIGAAATSCGDTQKSPTETENTTASADTTAVTEPVQARPNHNVPTEALDFHGEEFHMLAVDWQGYSYYFFADEENGDVMNDAIYHRKASVEDALNVKITYEYNDGYIAELVSLLKKTISSGDDIYDQAFLHCIQGVAELSCGGYLYNLDELPYIDIKADWWNRKQMDLLRLGENTYFAVNDFMIPCPYVVFWNKEMVENLDLDSPYQLVYDGKWTLDAFSKMAREAVRDVDGNGKMDENDSWGISTNEVSKYISFVTAADQYMTQKNSSGHVELALNTEKMHDLVSRFSDLQKDHVIYVPPTMEYTDMLSINSGRLLFQLCPISYAEDMRDYTVEFGLVPYPKYDEQQKDYISLDWGGLSCVPTTIQNHEMVGAVMELLAYKSAEEVIPTYYNMTLQGKLARDTDAVKMLDILFNTITYEIGGNYFGFDIPGSGNLFYSLPRVAIENGSTDFASWYQQNEKSAIKSIEKFYKNLAQNE